MIYLDTSVLVALLANENSAPMIRQWYGESNTEQEMCEMIIQAQIGKLEQAKKPNATTRKAMAELKAGKGERFDSVEALMADLHADD